MNRKQAKAYIWNMHYQVVGEFCCGEEEREAAYDETKAAIEALSK